MKSVNVLAKLDALKNHLNELAPNDAAFVGEMVTLNERGQGLNKHQILQIVDMVIPGEPPEQPDVRTFGLIKTVFVAPDKKVWRYMPLEQLFALLSMKALHFSPLSVMEDITEGQLPGRAWEESKNQLPQEILEGRGSMGADTMMAIMVAQRRTDACINCWYMDGSDSLKMWKEYAPKNGVAIQSTVHHLATSLQGSNMPVTISPVAYFAPEDEEGYINEAFYGSLYIKREPFRHEKELRALTYYVNPGHGVDIPVDIEILIERLVLSPELKDWAVPYITEAIRHFGFHGCIEKSTLTFSEHQQYPHSLLQRLAKTLWTRLTHKREYHSGRAGGPLKHLLLEWGRTDTKCGSDYNK